MTSSNSPEGTSAFPTFLDSDPFPSASRDGRPISSGTDATSESGGDEPAAAEKRFSNIPSVTGPVGEPGLPPSRPTSIGGSTATSQKRTSMQPPSSRRGLAAFVARDRNGSFKGSSQASEGAVDSRPGTAFSNRTHVPSLTPQGFFRPMSSQKLQAQRNQHVRPASKLGENVRSAGEGEESKQTTTRPRRYSNASVNTLRDGMPPTRDEDAPPLPVSRGTEFTSDGARTEGGTAASVVSKNSATPLAARSKPEHLKTNNLRGSNTPSAEKAPKSPRSLRASLGLSSRASKQDEKREKPGEGHQKLDSNPSSPQDASTKRELPSSSPSEKASPSQTTAGKNYEYTASNTLFLCAGRLLNTRAKPLNIMTFTLTLLPGILFFVFSAPYLWRHLSPAVPIIFAYVFLVCISSFAHAAFSDPGILPRNLHPHPPNAEEDRDLLALGPRTTEWVMVKTFPSSSSSSATTRNRTNGDAENGSNATPSQGHQAMEVPTKFCKSCNIWRPPRAHHCRICDACIETQDHHCVWLNNCVGRRNYRFFFAYVATATLLAILLLAFSLAHIGLRAQHQNISFAASLSGRTQERVAFAMFLYALLALPYPGSLFGYHLFLVARGETTREYLNSHKFPPRDRHRPFTQSSVLRNWLAVLMRPRPPTYMQFRHPHEAGDVRHGHLERKRERKVKQKEMSKQFSVAGRGGTGAEDEKGVEMKQLDPQAANGHTNGGGAGGGGGGATNGVLANNTNGTTTGHIGAAATEPNTTTTTITANGMNKPPKKKKSGPMGPGGLMDRTPR